MTRYFWIILALVLATGCSIKKMAVNSMADSLAGGSDVYASDEDPEFVRDAMPFALKTVESLLEQVPNHQGLLVSASSGFAQYAYAFLWLEAEEIESTDPQLAKHLRNRARRMFLRARDYGLRALEIDSPGFSRVLQKDVKPALSKMTRKSVPALYWTSASWAMAVTLTKGEMDLVADLPVIEAIMKRALELHEDFDAGAIHEFFLTYESGRAGGSLEKAREHFTKALKISGGTRMTPLVSLAENVSVQMQNRKEFLESLDRALAFDVNSVPKQRLVNLIAQKRARQLKARMEDLFLEEVPEEE